MPLQLPNLDDRRYNDLLAEALALIPAYSPEWTNYNPSDPGITLIELFAYLSEMLLYRLNRISDAHMRNFLKLLNGPDWVEPPNADLREEIRQTVLGIRERFRAVTKDDYEFLSMETFNQSLGSPQSPLYVARARCVPQRNLDAGSEPARLEFKPGHVSIVIVPANVAVTNPNPQPSTEQTSALLTFLDDRRVLTTRLHVTGPFYAHVSSSLVVARKPDVRSEDELATTISQALTDFLNPLPSETGSGWPFGRDVFVSDIYQLLEQLPGIDFVTDVMLDTSCDAGDDKCILADKSWNEEGELVGLRIQPHHLPVHKVVLDAGGVPQGIVIAPSTAFLARNASLLKPIPAFVIVNLKIAAKAAGDPKTLKQAIQSAVRSKFHPALGGPGPGTTQPTNMFVADVEVAVKNITGILDPVSVVANCIPASALQQDQNRGSFIHVEAGQVLDWHVQITLT